MGKIREQRRKDRKRKLMIQLGAGLCTTLAIALALILFLNGQNPQKTDGPIFGDKQSESQLGGSEVVKEETEEQEPESMQIVMVGDMLMHDKIIASGKKEDGTYNFDHLFTHVAEFISAADLAIVNQETMMGGPSYGYTGYPSFNSPYALADAEVKAGFDVLLLATNHTLDKTKKGVLNCMEYLDTNHPTLGYVGIN
ncbi:MAG: CapA family protein, partial [Agathobacter sp.]|nr:CapA family protein [Agathobacter sp.]